MELTSGHIRYEIRGHVAMITMDRPDKLNALSTAMTADLRVAFSEAEGDNRVRCLVITGVGRGFSTGEDVRDLRAQIEERAALAAAGSGIHEIPMPKSGSPLPRFILQAVSKPVVAAVNGVCAGMGYGIALASDIRIGSTEARFSHIYNRRGTVASAEVWFLPRLIGLGPALWYILMAEDMGAEDAQRLGLLSKVVARDDLMDTALEVANHLATGPAATMRFAKRAVYKALTLDLEQSMEYVGYARRLVASSGEGSEGTRSYLEKRAANFIP